MKLKASISLTVGSLQAHISERKKKILKRWLGFSRDLGCVSRRQAAEQSMDRVRGTAAPLTACTHLQPDAGVVRHLVGKETQPGHLRAA